MLAQLLIVLFQAASGAGPLDTAPPETAPSPEPAVQSVAEGSSVDGPLSAAPAPLSPAEGPVAAAPEASAPAPASGPLILLRPRAQGEPEDPRTTEQVFVSPMGEPFRGPIDAGYPVGTWFARADGDGNGALSREEFLADARGFFARIDANGDGAIDGFEDGDYEAKIAPEVSQGLSAGGEPNRRRRAGDPTGAARYGLLPEPQPVRAADADVDFRVTAAEWDAAAYRRFGRLDKNGDGSLGRDELPDTWEQERLAKELKDRREREEKAAKSRPSA